MTITFENKEIEVEKIFDNGWEGIVLVDRGTNEYYLYDLAWKGGGYVDRFKKITESDYIDFKNNP